MTETYAYLDEDSKKVVRRTILKALSVPGYQVPFIAPEMPIAYGWGVGGMVVTASLLGPDDTLKVTDHGSDETINAINIREFFEETAAVKTTARSSEATIIQVRQRVPEAELAEGQIVVFQVPRPDPLRAFVDSPQEAARMHAHADYGPVFTRLFEEQVLDGHLANADYDYPTMVEGRYLMSPSPVPKSDNPRLDGSPAIHIFGAARERRIYALPPYSRVESLSFDDIAFDPGQPQDGRYCVECGTRDHHLDRVLADPGNVKVWLCSDSECCAQRAAGRQHV